jgi:hypothetical protein
VRDADAPSSSVEIEVVGEGTAVEVNVDVEVQALKVVVDTRMLSCRRTSEYMRARNAALVPARMGMRGDVTQDVSAQGVIEHPRGVTRARCYRRDL